MPVMNGIELCHYMKKQDEWLHIPIILLTAKSSESDIIEGYEAGADDYITKPFQLTLLLVKIKSLLKNKENLLKNYSNIIAFEMQKPNIDSADKEFLQQLSIVYMSTWMTSNSSTSICRCYASEQINFIQKVKEPVE